MRHVKQTIGEANKLKRHSTPKVTGYTVLCKTTARVRNNTKFIMKGHRGEQKCRLVFKYQMTTMLTA